MPSPQLEELSTQAKYYSCLIQQLAPCLRGLDWKLEGFRPWARETYAACEDCEDADWHIGFTPDAWALDAEQRMVYILEIVESHDITEEKARRISNCFWYLDAAYWQLAVIMFYPKYSRTLYVDPLFLDGTAKVLAERQCPYSDAFTALKMAVPETHAVQLDGAEVA